MNVENWLGESNKIGINIFNKKYRYEDECFDEWLDRVAGGNETIRKLMVEKKFLPAGRILANRGLQNKGKKVTYGNCYLVKNPTDNLESIFQTASEIARTFSFGGGVGTDLSKLSPRGARINNAAKETSGAVSFMELYSLVTGLISQNGRRGALMISLDCNHPDLEEFINIKSDLNKVTKANISIKVTDEFMMAVKHNQEYTLSFQREETGEVIEKVVNAREIFHQFAEMNWQMAEPGVLFWDRINSWNLLSEDKDFKYAGVNPCFTGNMKLLTSDGYKNFSELINQKVNIVNPTGKFSEGKIWCSGDKEVIRLKLSNKKIIECTPDHIFLLNTNEQCPASELKGKRVKSYIGNTNTSTDIFVRLGFLQGDGGIGRINSDAHKGVEINIGHKDNEIFTLFNIEKVDGKRSYYENGYNDILISRGFDGSVLPERVLPITYNDWNFEEKRSFLKGCYSANGSVVKNHRISYKTTSKIFALQLIKSLNIHFGITAYMTTNKSKTVKFQNGDYKCKESYDVNISKLNDCIIFYQNIGFVQQYKINDLINLIDLKSPVVISIKSIGMQSVYDFTEPETNWGIVEGVIVHNCGEQTLPEYGSCNLASINLSEFIKNPFQPDAYFDFFEFGHVVMESVKYLNEVLIEGMELHPLKEQRECVRNWMQIGIGTMGISDMFIKLGIKYGSPESLSLCDSIGFAMINYAIKQSALLAKEFGAYPKYNAEAILNSDFFKFNITDKDIIKLVKKYGLYNSQLLSIAPNGSISNLLGLASGGIEPIYSLFYTRKTESLHGEDVYYTIYAPIVEEFLDYVDCDRDNLPDYFVTAMTLNYKDRIDMQSIWQTHIDAAISSTVNVPNKFTIEEVEELYTLAWKKGLKGLTIYRDGCARTGILSQISKSDDLDDDDFEEDDEEFELPRGFIEETPDDLTYRKYKLRTGCGNLYFFVGLDECEGKIYDCFTNTDGVGGCTVNTQANSRLLSAGLRGGIPIEYLTHQLEKSGTCASYQNIRGRQTGALKIKDLISKYDIPKEVISEINDYVGKPLSNGKSCASACGYILKNIIKEFENQEHEEIAYEIAKKEEILKSDEKDFVIENSKCPDCGNSLRFEGGCATCNCGWSKCG